MIGENVPRLLAAGKASARLGAPANRRLAWAVLCAIFLMLSSGCSKLIKYQVGVPTALTPLVDADAQTLIDEVNRLAQVHSINSKLDIEFLDTTFAKCGVAEKYRTAEAKIIAQRPAQIYISIQGPFSTKIAEMTSNGEQFRVAILQGDEKYRRFVKGKNNAVYPKINNNVMDDCSGKNKTAMTEKHTVSALSSLRPQHLTDALLIRPAAQSGANFIYARSEEFEEETDLRPNAKKGARVLRGYYILDELAPEAVANRARLVRRFWFDRVGSLRLARVQNYNEQGAVVTDVVYRDPKNFGAETKYSMPSVIELTRPQDRYAIRLTYQTPDATKINETYEPQIFNLENSAGLPEFDLDSKNGISDR
jgi:hypothetical protein